MRRWWTASITTTQPFPTLLMGELRTITLNNARQKVKLLRSSDVRISGMRILDVGASSGAWLEVAEAEGSRRHWGRARRGDGRRSPLPRA